MDCVWENVMLVVAAELKVRFGRYKTTYETAATPEDICYANGKLDALRDVVEILERQVGDVPSCPYKKLEEVRTNV